MSAPSSTDRALLQPAICAFFGRPASGKGTLAKLLKDSGYDHVSTGDVVRDEVARQTPIGLQYKDDILNHRPIPPAIVQQLVEQRLNQAVKAQRGVVLDGYPKTLEQCQFLDRFTKEHGLENRTLFVLIDVAPETALARMSSRQTCKKCERIYNAKFSPPKVSDQCDQCREPLTQRSDDNPANMERRVTEFSAKMKPALDHYAKRLHTIDGSSTPEACRQAFLKLHHAQIKAPKKANYIFPSMALLAAGVVCAILRSRKKQ